MRRKATAPPVDETWGEGRFEEDWLNAGFVTVPVVLVFDDKVTGGAKASYAALCWHIWRAGKVPPQSELAEELGGGVRTIKRHLAELEAAGYIERVQHGLGRPNDYIIKSLRDRGPKMALPEGHSRPVKGATKGTSIKGNKDLKSHIQQQPTSAVAPDEVGTHQDLVPRLRALGVAKATALKMLGDADPAVVYRWVCYVEHRLEGGWVPRETPAAWIVSAIQSGDWTIPEWFKTPEEQVQEAVTSQRQAASDRRRQETAEREESGAAEAQRQAVEDRLGIGEDTREVWAQALVLLRERDQGTVALSSAFLLPLQKGVATIATPIPFFRRVIADHGDNVRVALEEVTGQSIERIEVRQVTAERIVAEVQSGGESMKGA